MTTKNLNILAMVLLIIVSSCSKGTQEIEILEPTIITEKDSVVQDSIAIPTDTSTIGATLYLSTGMDSIYIQAINFGGRVSPVFVRNGFVLKKEDGEIELRIPDINHINNQVEVQYNTYRDGQQGGTILTRRLEHDLKDVKVMGVPGKTQIEPIDSMYSMRFSFTFTAMPNENN